MSAAIVPISPLSQHAHKANREHRFVVESARDMLIHARKAGRHLSDAKTLVGPGWLNWLAKNFDGSQSTASLYMRIYARWSELEPLVSNGVTNLSLRAARDILTTRTRRDAVPPALAAPAYVTWQAIRGSLTLDEDQERVAAHLVAQRPAILLDQYRVVQQFNAWYRFMETKPQIAEIEIGNGTCWHDGLLTIGPDSDWTSTQMFDAPEYRDEYPTHICVYVEHLRHVFALSGPEATMRLTDQCVDVRYGSYRWLVWSIDLQDIPAPKEIEDARANERALTVLSSDRGLLKYID